MAFENHFNIALLSFLKMYNEPKVKLFKKINKSVLSHPKFYLEDDDHKPIDFNGEFLSFTCQPNKI